MIFFFTVKGNELYESCDVIDRNMWDGSPSQGTTHTNTHRILDKSPTYGEPRRNPKGFNENM